MHFGKLKNSMRIIEINRRIEEIDNIIEQCDEYYDADIIENLNSELDALELELNCMNKNKFAIIQGGK